MPHLLLDKINILIATECLNAVMKAFGEDFCPRNGQRPKIGKIKKMGDCILWMQAEGR